MGQLGMGQIPSHPTGMGWDWDSKIVIFMGWDGTVVRGMGWDRDEYLWDSGMGQKWDLFGIFRPKEILFSNRLMKYVGYD